MDGIFTVSSLILNLVFSLVLNGWDELNNLGPMCVFVTIHRVFWFHWTTQICSSFRQQQFQRCKMMISKDETSPYTTEHRQDTMITYGDCSTGDNNKPWVVSDLWSSRNYSLNYQSPKQQLSLVLYRQNILESFTHRPATDKLFPPESKPVKHQEAAASIYCSNNITYISRLRVTMTPCCLHLHRHIRWKDSILFYSISAASFYTHLPRTHPDRFGKGRTKTDSTVRTKHKVTINEKDSK